MQFNDVGIGHSHTTVRRRTQQSIQAGGGIPARAHCSVDVYSPVFQFSDVQLERTERVSAKQGLAVRRIGVRTVFGRDVILFPSRCVIFSGWRQMPVSSHDNVRGQQDRWSRVSLVLSADCECSSRSGLVENNRNCAAAVFLTVILTSRHCFRIQRGAWSETMTHTPC